MKRFISLAVTVFMLSMGFYGCGSKEVKPAPSPTPSAMPGSGAPAWVTKGSGAFGADKGKVFYGVGSASGIRNLSLLRSTADNRARNELAKVFEVYTASLMKDYMASTSAGDPKASSEEQHIEQAIKTVTSATLNGVEMVDHWQDPNTQEFFSLAKLDMAAFKDMLDKSKELNDKTKEYVRKNADRLHDQLEKEEEKAKTR